MTGNFSGNAVALAFRDRCGITMGNHAGIYFRGGCPAAMETPAKPGAEKQIPALNILSRQDGKGFRGKNRV
jgi:hypothetical protein